MDLSETTAEALCRHPPRVALANAYPFRPGECVGPHASASVMLLTACSGRGRLEFADGGLELLPGSVLVVPWLAPRRYCADRAEPFSLIGVHLVPGEGGAPMHTANHTGTWNCPLRSPPRLPSLADPDLSLRAAMEACERAFAAAPGPFRDAALLGCGLALAAGVAGALRGQPPAARPSSTPVPAGIAAVESWLRLSLAKPMSRDALARRAGLSPSHFAGAFRKAYGRAPLEHLQELRLREAARLLRSSAQPVAAIAAAVGIEALWFSRLFRRRFGASPRAWRAANRRL